MKKILYLSTTMIIALASVFSFSACDSENKAEHSSENSKTSLNSQSVDGNSNVNSNISSVLSSGGFLSENSYSTAQGGSGSVESVTSDSLENSTSKDSETSSGSENGEDKVILPNELSPTEVIYTYLEMQKGFSGYKQNTVGTTKAKKGIISYEQKANNTTYKCGNEYFQECTSNSTFVNMTHQAYVKGNKVAYRNSSSGEITVVDKNKYKEIYGISPDDDAIGGYIVNSKTLKSVEKTKEVGGLYTYRIVLDAKPASSNLVKQMKEFGGLNGYPEVHTLTLYLTIKADWTPTKLVVESTYDISIAVLGNMSCTHDFTTEFSQVNSTVVIPNVTDFSNKLVNS